MNGSDESGQVSSVRSESAVNSGLEGDVWVVTLHRPGAGNAIDLALADGLIAALATRPTEARSVLLVGSGKRFCVGGDITAFAGAADPGEFVGRLASHWHRAVRSLLACPVPTVLGVHGAVAGAAVGLLGACDIAVCARSTLIRPAYGGIGFSPDGGTSWVLARGLGTARALDLLLTDGTLTASEAHAAGLVARVVEDGELGPAALNIARKLAEGPLAALARTRHLARAAMSRDLDTHLSDEAALIASSANDADGREGVQAFIERRPPNFRNTPTPTKPERRQ